MIRAILTICSWLPLVALHKIAWFWGTMLYLIPNRTRETTRLNLKTCFPELNENEINQITRESLINTACTALEMGKAWLVPIEKTVGLVASAEGYDEFRSAVDAGDGVLLLAPHLSNWEIFGFFACEGVRSNFMYQPPRIAGLDKLLRNVRARSGIALAPTNRKGVAMLLNALKRGEMVGILPDQVPADSSGLFTPFYGEPALTMTLVSKLLQRTNAKVFCGYAKRLPRSAGFIAVFKEAHPSIYSNDIEESVGGLNKTIESVVNDSVSQYQWEYKRFRRRPDNSEFYNRS